MFTRRRRKGHNFSSQLKIMWITDSHQTDGDGKAMPEFVSKVNEIKPDLVIHTGDMVQSEPVFDQFLTHWNQIDPTITKALTIGNHDLDKVTMQQAADALGYGTKPLINNSRFNQTFVINGVRIIMLDTVDNNPNFYWGYANETLRNWIAGILASCQESNVIMFMHHGPQAYWTPTPAFVEVDAMALKAVVENALKANPIIQKISACFGHRHGNTEVYTYNNLGEYFIGYLNVSSVDNHDWLFTRVEVSKNKLKFYKAN